MEKHNFIFSSGHSNLSISDFIGKMKTNKISVLVDARSSPYSRFCPWFNRDTFQKSLEKENIKYLWRGSNIGGKKENVDYDKAIIEISEIAKNNINVCIVCAERDFKKCHRYLTLTPSLEKQGLLVKHI